uniref:Mitochondrial-processing peptidase subunit beta n=1 Tax=Strigamia maritima TaxID=126957 RepID=T1JF64_STRMM
MAVRLIIPKRWSGPGVGRARILSYQDALASIPETTITTLSNGIRVGTETTPLPICTVGVWLDAGSRYETNRTNGVANLLEHMLFKGRQKRPQAELEAEIEAMGAYLNAYTTRELISSNSKLEESEIEREKGVIMREMEEAETNISDVVLDHLHSMAYEGTPLGIRSITKNDIINYIKNTCKSSRIVLAAAGGVRHEELVELGNQHFNKITQTYEGAVPILIPTRFTGSEMRHRDDWMPFANIALAVEGAGWISPDCIPLMVASSMVSNWDQTYGGGQNLSSNVASIVAKNKACHSFQSFYTCYRDTGLWGIQYICEAMKCEMTLHAIQEEWMRMCTSLTFTEVERTKNTLRTKLLDQLDGTTGVCEDIGRQLLSFNRRIPLIELEAQIAAVTPQTIRDVLMTYVYNRCPAVAAVGPVENLPDYTRIRSGIFGGFLFAYNNVRLVRNRRPLIYEGGFLQITIRADFIIFCPEIGKPVRGVVNKYGRNYVTCSVHDLYNACIPRPEGEAEWIGDCVDKGYSFLFTVTMISEYGLCGSIIDDSVTVPQAAENELEYEENEEVIDENEEVIDENEEVIDENEEVIDENEEVIDENEEVIDENEEVIDENEEVIDENEEVIDENEEVIDENEEVIDDVEDVEVLKVFGGFLIAYNNVRLVRNRLPIIYEGRFLEIKIQADFIIFCPEIGKPVRGVVNKYGRNYVSCLVHEVYNASIPRPEGEAEWIGDCVDIGYSFLFTVTNVGESCLRGIIIDDSVTVPQAAENELEYEENEDVQIESENTMENEEVIDENKDVDDKTNDLEERVDETKHHHHKKKKRKLDEMLNNGDNTMNDVEISPRKKKKLKLQSEDVEKSEVECDKKKNVDKKHEKKKVKLDDKTKKSKKPKNKGKKHGKSRKK